jgi:hypothetical protein
MLIDGVTLSGPLHFENATVSQSKVLVAGNQIDCAAGNYFYKEVDGTVALDFINAPAAVFSFVLEVKLISGSLSFPAGIEWPAGTAPLLATGKTHMFIFVKRATIFRGSYKLDY